MSQASLFDDAPMGELERAFWKFHRENPRVYQLIGERAQQAIAAGFQRFSMKTIFELVRWHEWVVTTDCDFKLNNNYHAFYARLWMREHPEHPDFFALRRQKQEMVG